MLNASWFEMTDIRKKKFNKSVWIPVRVSETKIKTGSYGYAGYSEEYFGCGSIAVPLEQIENVKKLDWDDIGLRHNHRGFVEDFGYVPAESYINIEQNIQGVNLVLVQHSPNGARSIWHLNQDIVLSLELIREGNSWLIPKDDYTEVAKIKFNQDGDPISLEIRAQYLKDYLCARQMALYLTCYHERKAICADASHIPWSHEKETTETDTWEGRVSQITEGGFHEQSMAVYHVARTDVDEYDDIPDLSAPPTEENTISTSWTKQATGRKFYEILGARWSTEIILPGTESPVVRGDNVVPTASFIIDETGKKESAQELEQRQQWLWFNPRVIEAICKKRDGFLKFYTAHTGRVSASYGYGVHFGVNKLGLVNVYAEDIARLPDWQQQIWAAHNEPPEGGVSSELLASQVRAAPAATQAPESFLSHTFQNIHVTSQATFGNSIFRKHQAQDDLIPLIHRFKAVDEASFYALAKDLARLIVDSLDITVMQSIFSPSPKEKLGSIKTLEKLLSIKYDLEFVRKVTAPLVGIYELRHADAHLPTSKIDNAFTLIAIDREQPFVYQGFQMLHWIVSSLNTIAKLIEKWDDTYAYTNIRV